MRILLVDNLMIRRWGNLRMGPGRKLACGAVRNDWRLCEFSARDQCSGFLHRHMVPHIKVHGTDVFLFL